MRHQPPFGPQGFERPFRGGGRGGGRMFDQGDLRWVVLQLVAEQPRHGYEIIKEIESRVGGGYSPSPGVIYPTLTLLEEMGWLVVTSCSLRPPSAVVTTSQPISSSRVRVG